METKYSMKSGRKVTVLSFTVQVWSPRLPLFPSIQSSPQLSYNWNRHCLPVNMLISWKSLGGFGSFLLCLDSSVFVQSSIKIFRAKMKAQNTHSVFQTTFFCNLSLTWATPKVMPANHAHQSKLKKKAAMTLNVPPHFNDRKGRSGIRKTTSNMRGAFNYP